MKKIRKEKRYNKNQQWAVDQDYFKSLSPADRDWLTKFNDEYYKGHVKKGDPKALHNTDQLRKECYNRNNAQNRDLFGIGGCTNNLVFDYEITDGEGNSTTLLDTIADYDLSIVRLENQE